MDLLDGGEPSRPETVAGEVVMDVADLTPGAGQPVSPRSGTKALPKPGAAARSVVAHARSLRAGIDEALAAPAARQQAARLAFEAVRDSIVQQQLASIPIARLRETTQGRLRLGAIEEAGYRTVGQATAADPYWLEEIPGVGPQTASKVIAAAHQLEAAMTQAVRVRFDPDTRPADHTRLLAMLHAYEAAEQAVSPLRAEMERIAGHLNAIIGDADRACSRMKMFFAGRRKRENARIALEQIDTLMTSPVTARSEAALRNALSIINRAMLDPRDLWQDYEVRAVAYNGLLIDVAGLSPDPDAAQGFVPAEIAQRVLQQPLDVTLLNASLRGYQAFGAKFALTERRAILGDEMGLGKTIEALAAMCHLYIDGHKHFLVVCPASVLINWMHETQRHSQLRPYRLHGPDRPRNLRAWVRHGGVAVTTYEALRSLRVPDSIDVAMLVADEAHYTKNPAAARTRAVQGWAAKTDRVLFLTGTPMENRVEEFRTLVGHIQPAMAARISAVDGVLGPSSFRKAVASVYLRRNQSDVLEELPPRIDTQEWVRLDGAALTAYRHAVAAGNFMAMRRAAYAPRNPDGSAKLARLVEIVDEATMNGRKIVIFSYFREVLQTVTSVLGSIAIGPLTGSVPPTARQALVDQFTSRDSPAVLVSQIQAGGVGLNIQAASVVILTEPQWKPTIEDQAIARCHRMGQVRTVDAHRLLAEDSVDDRMLEVLATKAILFDEYVRRSELKEISPDAVDVSDMAATREAVTQAEAERRIVEMERKRLRLEPNTSAAHLDSTPRTDRAP